MLKRTLCLVIFSTCVVGSAFEQFPPSSGRYRIVGGQFAQCCGFSGQPIVYRVPSAGQTFVELRVDAGNRARMTILAADGRTIFRTFSFEPEGGFPFSFSNGFVFGNSIRFAQSAPPPNASYSYVVSNTANGLLIQGEANVPCPGCADIPTHFEHTAVTTASVPVPVIDKIRRDNGSFRFHFSGFPPNDYTVEYTDSLQEPNWLPLTTYRAKLTAIDIVVTNTFTNATARFFRLRKEPCNCD